MTVLARRSVPSDELDEIAALARPLAAPAGLDPLLDRVGDARFVLLGEASHGTSEYYGWRAAITRRLVAERGFSFVAVEGDWPDCFALNRRVKGRAGGTAREVAGRFERWPAWMRANEEVAAFAGWLRDHDRRTGDPVGFYASTCTRCGSRCGASSPTSASGTPARSTPRGALLRAVRRGPAALRVRRVLLVRRDVRAAPAARRDRTAGG